MLTTIREKTQGVIATFILFLIVIPFALWGINSYFDGGSRLDVASVNGEKISERAYRETLERFRGQLDARMAENPEVKRAVIEGLIDESLLTRDAQAQGYRLGKERLAATIRELPYFKTGERFDPNLYESLLRREGISMQEFETRRRTEAVTTQVQSGFVESGIVTEAEINTLVKLVKQERQVSYANIDVERLQSNAKIAPDAVENYYNAHPDLFMTQEQVRIEYVRLSAQALANDYRPTEADLRKLYAEDSSKEVRPETRRASHILIALAPGASEDDVKKALTTIQDIEKQARAGADFTKLARAHSQDPDSANKGGDLGDVRSGVLPKPLEDAVFTLKSGELSKPVRTEYGYHLVKLTGHQPAVQKSFEQMREQLLKQSRQKQVEDRFYEASEKFRTLVYEQADSLVPASEALGLKVETSDWFGHSGGSGITAHPRVIEAAFSADVLQQKRNSDAFEISGDTLMSIRIADHRPAERKPLAEVKAQIERTLRQEVAQKTANELGESVVKELDAGQSLQAVAAKHGLKIQGPKILSRGQSQGIDAALMGAVFRAARPDGSKAVYGGVNLGSKGYTVFALTQVQDFDPSKVDAVTRNRVKQSLMSQRGAGYYAGYRSSLKQRADIDIYQDRL